MFFWQTATYIFSILALVSCQYNFDYSYFLPNSQSNLEDSYYETLFRNIFTNRTNFTMEQINTENAEGEACTCVKYYGCADGMINMHGKTLFEFRINDPNNTCEGKLEKCCSVSKIKKSGFAKTDPRTWRSCGRRNADGLGVHFRDMSPTQSQYGEFPWMVAISRQSVKWEDGIEDDSYQCGGSLIHPRVVLTAAHCVTKEDAAYTIRAGDWNTKIVEEYYPTQDRVVDRVIRHENFDYDTGFNDIALLVLKNPVALAENIGLVCLPDQDEETSSGTCIATGWGKDFIGLDAKPNEILKKLHLPVVPPYQCQKNLRRTRLGRYFVLHENFMCAGGEPGRDTCEGDGGGPLVCPLGKKKRQYFQAGILSFGVGCSRKNVPGVYVSVAKYRNWIDEKLESCGLDTSGYQARDINSYNGN